MANLLIGRLSGGTSWQDVDDNGWVIRDHGIIVNLHSHSFCRESTHFRRILGPDRLLRERLSVWENQTDCCGSD